MKTLFYTFRTFPFISAVQEIDPNIFVIGKLKQDLSLLFEKILDEKPDMILGLAKSHNKNSYIEKFAINQFNKNKKVLKNVDLDKIELFVPQINFKINLKPSDSFCNYAMFQIAYFIQKEKIGAKSGFIHINSSDIPKLLNIV